MISEREMMGDGTMEPGEQSAFDMVIRQRDDLQKANNEYRARYQKAEGRLRGERATFALYSCWIVLACLGSLLLGNSMAHVGDNKRVKDAQIDAAIDKESAGFYRDMMFKMTDDMVSQAQRAQACEDGVTSQFDMRRFDSQN